MTEHAWFKLFLRGIGLLLLGLAFPGMLTQLGYLVQMVHEGEFAAPSPYLWMYGGALLGTIAQAGIGLYLLFGGGWIVTRCMREIRDRCIACGYDLSAATGEVCTECGTPIIRPPAPPPPAATPAAASKPEQTP